MARRESRSSAACGHTVRGGFRIKTTVGELVAAAYEAAEGKVERAAEIIEHGPLHLVGRRLRFV